MSHVQRLRTSDRIFFITVNLRRGATPLTGGEYALGVGALAASRRKLHFLLSGFVVMPDQGHALIWTSSAVTISRVVQDIQWLSARALNHARSTAGWVWQQQFWDRFVRQAKEFNERLVYRHLNPVRKGLVKQPEAWRWSSYNNFALDKERVAACPLQIDSAPLLESYRA